MIDSTRKQATYMRKEVKIREECHPEHVLKIVNLKK
jgi:hypothetical protein